VSVRDIQANSYRRKFITNIFMHPTHKLLCLLPLPLSTFLLLLCSPFLSFLLKFQKSNCKNGNVKYINPWRIKLLQT
jgi:hypothetical protein